MLFVIFHASDRIEDTPVIDHAPQGSEQYPAIPTSRRPIGSQNGSAPGPDPWKTDNLEPNPRETAKGALISGRTDRTMYSERGFD
jgi:hypothetical protein